MEELSWDLWTYSPAIRCHDTDILLLMDFSLLAACGVCDSRVCSQKGNARESVCVIAWTVKCEDKVFLEVNLTPALVARPQ